MLRSTFVIVDDIDPNISYTGNWSAVHDSTNKFYNGTAHNSPPLSTDVVSISYNFTGTQIVVAGRFSASSHSSDSTFDLVRCLVDGEPQKIFPNLDQPAFCQADDLSDSVHQLVLSIPPAVDPLQITVDFLFYLPSQSFNSVSLNKSRDIFLAPNNTGITARGWELKDPLWLHTVDTHATFDLNFTGNSITWLTCRSDDMAKSAANITYRIDSGDVRPVHNPNLNNLILFQESLEHGNHQLNLVYNQDPEVNQKLSSCGIVIGNGTVAEVVIPPSTSISPASSTSSPTSVPSPSDSSPSESGTSAANISGTMTAAKVLGLIGGIVLLYLLVLAILLLRVRRKIKRRSLRQGLLFEFVTGEARRNSVISSRSVDRLRRTTQQSVQIPSAVVHSKRWSAQSSLSTFLPYNPSYNAPVANSDYRKSSSSYNSMYDTL